MTNPALLCTFEVRVFDSISGATLLQFDVQAEDFPAAMELAHPRVEDAALACFAAEGEPEVELTLQS